MEGLILLQKPSTRGSTHGALTSPLRLASKYNNYPSDLREAKIRQVTMVFIFSFASEVKPRRCLAGQQRSIPALVSSRPRLHFHRHQTACPRYPSEIQSHTSAELASDSEHLPYTLVPYAHVTLPRKRDAKKSPQNTRVAAEKLRKMH